MKKYFIGILWQDQITPIIHLKDYYTNEDEYVCMPDEFELEIKNKKICTGTINPYTREYVSCSNPVEKGETQCSRCKYLYDFYKCVRCHGDKCNVNNVDVLNYCNSNHYVYLAYFNGGKIKVGTASEAKKYDRLLEQGALSAIFIAKTPTGKIARTIEKEIIDSGVNGMVTTNYKMKNIILVNNDQAIILKQLFDKHKDILKIVTSELQEYLIEPEVNVFTALNDKIKNNMLIENTQINLFEQSSNEVKQYVIKKDFHFLSGKYLFALGKILAIEKNGTVELIDTKKIEGYLIECKNMNYKNIYSNSRKVGR